MIATPDRRGRRVWVNSGYTVLELLIATSLTLVVMGTALTLFEAYSRIRDAETRKNEILQTGRLALDVWLACVERERQHSGSWRPWPAACARHAPPQRALWSPT